MAGTSWRRKHSACMLRIRESCPFRKLRKNKCIVSSSSEAAGRRWGNSQVSVSAVASGSETYPPTLSTRAFFHHQPQQQQQQPPGELSDMDAETAPCVSGPSFSNHSAGAYSEPSASNLIRLHQNSLSTSDPSMELDSGVDPETGERAQG